LQATVPRKGLNQNARTKAKNCRETVRREFLKCTGRKPILQATVTVITQLSLKLMKQIYIKCMIEADKIQEEPVTLPRNLSHNFFIPVWPSHAASSVAVLHSLPCSFRTDPI
jgi:hypothetical protein